LERLQTLWQNYLDSTEVFTMKQGGSLAYFCSNLDKFSNGPISDGKGNSDGTGKLTGTELLKHNLKAAGFTN
jgi:hypothetical protein